MSDSREKLLGRFRAILLARVREVRTALGDVTAAGAEDTLKRELHTFKGEARMLGLIVQSELAHALEERLPLVTSAGGAEAEAVLGRMMVAIDAVARSLAESADAGRADAEVQEALAVLSSAANERAVESLAPHGATRETGAQPGTEASAAPAGRPAARGRWTQIEAAAIDRLCARMTELSSAYAELQARAVRELGAEALSEHRDRLSPLIEELERCRGALDECTVNAWSLRLVAVEPTLVELGRHASAIARSTGKPVEVRIEAAGVQLESDVLDQLWDSLLHLVQNAVEHGVEAVGGRGDKPASATLVISAESTGPSVVLGVEDDGRGIDVEHVRDVAIARGMVPPGTPRLTEVELLDVLCRQGFTTKSSVTALSGRGVGLDVVRSKAEALGGTVRVETWRGFGTRFQLHVPFAITKERMLVIEAADLLLGIPVRLIRTVVELGESGGERPDVLKYQGETLPLRSLGGVLGLAKSDELVAVIMEIAGRKWAIAIPRALGERDLIRSPADPLLLRTSLFGATALLEDGRLVLIPQLDRMVRLLRASTRSLTRPQPAAARRRRVLVVDDSPVIRDLVAEVLTSVGLEVTVASDGAQGLRSIEASEPDLVLSDVEMPTVDGFEMLRQIRTRSQRLPVVMLTTRGSVEDRKRASSLGANAYLVKSEFEGGALVEVIQRFLDLPGMKRIRIIVADDSPICRAELRQILEQDRDIEIVGEASDGGTMLELLERHNPNLIVVDLQMPGVDGLTTVEQVMANRPVPILVVTSRPEGRNRDVVFEAIRRGALDLAEKPGQNDAKSQALLRAKVRQLAPIPVIRHVAGRPHAVPPKAQAVGSGSFPGAHRPLVGVAASAGGPAALVSLLKEFPKDFPACFAVVQHLPRGFSKAFSEYLQSRLKLVVRVGEEGSKIVAGHVYVAPDDCHLIVRSPMQLGLDTSPPIEGHRPAATALLSSLARVLGKAGTGIILSGIGHDGVAGLRELRARGGLTLAQDESSSAVYGMPRSALESGAAQRALDPASLARTVMSALGHPSPAGGRS